MTNRSTLVSSQWLAACGLSSLKTRWIRAGVTIHTWRSFSSSASHFFHRVFPPVSCMCSLALSHFLKHDRPTPRMRRYEPWMCLPMRAWVGGEAQSQAHASDVPQLVCGSRHLSSRRPLQEAGWQTEAAKLYEVQVSNQEMFSSTTRTCDCV